MNNLPILKIFLFPFKLFVILISSYILVHIFGLLGIFLFIGYPIWWLFFPQASLCLGCRSKKDGEICRICKKQVKKSEGYYPKNFRSALINSMFLLGITIFSMTTVYGEYMLIKNFVLEDKTSVEFSIPSESEYKIGEIFPLKLEISGNETTINAVQADIGFDKDKIEALDISLKDSFATVFIEKEINNDLGYIRLSGGLPNPGFSNDKGTFGTIYFRTKEAGLTQIFFLQSSLVLANDGKGTNILREYPTIPYLIRPDFASITEQELQYEIFEKSVLGTNISKESIVFFGKDNSSVLGIDDISKPADDGKIWGYILDIITVIDTFIINFWNMILNKY